MNVFQRQLRIVPIAAVAMGAGSIFFAAPAADMRDSDKVSKPLSDVRTQAA